MTLTFDSTFDLVVGILSLIRELLEEFELLVLPPGDTRSVASEGFLISTAISDLPFRDEDPNSALPNVSSFSLNWLFGGINIGVILLFPSGVRASICLSVGPLGTYTFL